MIVRRAPFPVTPQGNGTLTDSNGDAPGWGKESRGPTEPENETLPAPRVSNSWLGLPKASNQASSGVPHPVCSEAQPQRLFRTPHVCRHRPSLCLSHPPSVQPVRCSNARTLLPPLPAAAQPLDWSLLQEAGLCLARCHSLSSLPILLQSRAASQLRTEHLPP